MVISGKEVDPAFDLPVPGVITRYISIKNKCGILLKAGCCMKLPALFHF
jgi:hypothetical protein